MLSGGNILFRSCVSVVAKPKPNLLNCISCGYRIFLQSRQLGYMRRENVLRKNSLSRILLQKRFTGDSTNSGIVTVTENNGRAVLSIPLPSTNEKCSFVVNPISSVEQFFNDIRREDDTVKRTALHTKDGARASSNTQMGFVLGNNFTLTINEDMYEVVPPTFDNLHCLGQTNDMFQMIAHLSKELEVNNYYAKQEQQLTETIDNLKQELEPLENDKDRIIARANSRTNLLMWGGMAYMAAQFGVLARLTWWEYSWDIMEPVTYFITYGTAIIMYGYFLLTKQEYIYMDARERQYLRFFHKTADRSGFDVEKYNRIQDQLAQSKSDLERLQNNTLSSLALKQKDDATERL